MHSIGYTADKNSKKRFESYKNHNPFFEILFTISGGTEQNNKTQGLNPYY